MASSDELGNTVEQVLTVGNSSMMSTLTFSVLVWLALAQKTTTFSAADGSSLSPMLSVEA